MTWLIWLGLLWAAFSCVVAPAVGWFLAYGA